MSLLPLTQIKRKGIETLADLRSSSVTTSREAGTQLVAQAKAYGLGVREFLTLSIDPRLSEDKQFAEAGLNGYEASLAYLGLPVKNDFANGVVLEAAGETFQTFPGIRALFPEVVDDVVKWKYRQDSIEKVEPLVANSRTVAGVEMQSTVIDDKADDYQIAQEIAEGTRVPVKSIRGTEYAVRFYKHGMGYRTTYEFERRARLDLLTPYANRAMREMDRSKVRWATLMLLNGDAVHSAAPVKAQSAYDAAAGTAATAGKLSYKHLLLWFVERAKAGVPVDTVVGNWDAYIDWLMLFALPTSSNNRTDADNLAAMGFQIGGVPLLTGVVNFVLSSTMPAKQLLGFSRGDTLEELVEAGSSIAESERSVLNQTVNYIRTENSGYRLVFGDTRSVFDYSA
jgi:hypothetical protein